MKIRTYREVNTQEKIKYARSYEKKYQEAIRNYVHNKIRTSCDMVQKLVFDLQLKQKYNLIEVQDFFIKLPSGSERQEC